MKLFLTAITAFILLGFYALPTKAFKSYTVKKTDYKIQALSETLPDSEWDKAIYLDDFYLPWNSETPQKTSFRALHNDHYLFLRYIVEDNNIIFTDSVIEDEMEIARVDRVEIFFAEDKELRNYYCLEIDGKGHVLDYKASYYRKFDDTWDWPDKQLYINAIVATNGYSVDVVIGKASLENLKLLKNNVLHAGIFRGDREADLEQGFKWITWVVPNVKQPDFHVPSAFGILKLE